MPECPYGASNCPKVNELEDRLHMLEKNQAKLMKMMYYIAGIVSVTLGINVIV